MHSGYKSRVRFSIIMSLKAIDNSCKLCAGKKLYSFLTTQCNKLAIYCNKSRNITTNVFQNMKIPSSGHTSKHKIQYG
jgi:pyruvate formate-lyase activating enzyme-like uncharacterized protein